MSYPIPLLRIEVEGVKHQILHAFQDYNDEAERIIKAELEKVDIPGIITAEVRQAIPFMIQQAVTRAVESIGRELESIARADLSPIVTAAFQDAVRQAQEGEMSGGSFNKMPQ
jgi:hypothetical protein